MTTTLQLRNRGVMAGVAGPLVLDTFTRADGALLGSTADTGQVWGGELGTDMVVKSNRVAETVGGSTDIDWIDVGRTDCLVTMTIAVMGGPNGLGLCARYVNASNYYFADVLDTGAIRLYKVVANVFTSLGSPSGTFVAGDILGLRVVGTAISVLRNGAAALAATDSSLAAGTKVGIRTGGAGTTWRGDNFTVVAAP